MNTKKELDSITLSATKKDFYQIWNELLETAGKLSKRWDPESTNESDPGIVLLKVLTAIADKLNYTIDKNTLEAFMPSAAQEDSMRKLCDMMGYSMKYYQSATTEALISYIGKEPLDNFNIIIPKYTNLKNEEDDVNYFTLEDRIINKLNTTITVPCMEGEVVYCADDTDNIISIAQLDDNHRYYLPEEQIAENGMFITNLNDSSESDLWEKVDNLNTQQTGKKCFKFGYDSSLRVPYVQFPDDISSIIEDGLVIKYTRTNGINGNISYGVLTSLVAPSIWGDSSIDAAGKAILVVDNFNVKNTAAAINGKNKETINDAYSNYKKTIGTFDTLVTCRDYMNKIYQMTESETNTTPLVSNIIVSDIRDDINKAIVLCSFNDNGICYLDRPIIKDDKKLIEHFDLILYPFTTVTGTNTKTEYDNSFKYSASKILDIESELDKNKTISHNIKLPENNDIVCIKNYLRLSARITTTTKVNAIEEQLILKNIYSTIYAEFNLRKLDFGEEITFDSIYNAIRNADTRIKNVSLDTPVLCTVFMKQDGTEIPLEKDDSKDIYNKLALRNVLGGRIPLFEYINDFVTSYLEQNYHDAAPILPTTETDHIKELYSNLKLDNLNELSVSDNNLTLSDNEVIQFRAPNYRTTLTYPAYVNYYLKLSDTNDSRKAIPATFGTLRDFLHGNLKFEYRKTTTERDLLEAFANNSNIKSQLTVGWTAKPEHTIDEIKEYFKKYNEEYCAQFIKNASETFEWVENHDDIGPRAANVDIYVFEITAYTIGVLNNYIKNQPGCPGSEVTTLDGLFISLGVDLTRNIGKYIDANKIKYKKAEVSIIGTDLYNKYFVQITHDTDSDDWTKDGLGKDAEHKGIKAGTEYYLKANKDYLFIQYTPSITKEDGTTTTGTPVKEVITNKIIKPNFELVNSEQWHETHSYSKLGVDFTDTIYGKKINDDDGMFTLGSNEQIELREQVQVILDSNLTKIYWERNDDELNTENGYVKFILDEDEGKAYTLKEGEYFYYTDSSETDLAYYGNGTKLSVIGDVATKLIKKASDKIITEDITNFGLLAAIPWITINLNATNKITLLEYQYRNLIAGDTLTSISGVTTLQSFKNFPSAVGSTIESLEPSWSTVTAATFKYSDGTIDYLPEIHDNSVSWEARSILSLNVSSDITQTLTNRTNITESIAVIYDNDICKNIITPDTNADPLSIKTNYAIQTSSGYINAKKLTAYVTSAAGDLNYKNDFKIKQFKLDKTLDTLNWINFNNYGTGHWTKLSFNEIPDNKDYINLHINLPGNSKGLIMFNYSRLNADTDITKYASISADSEANIKIFNANNYDTLCADGWWKDYKISNTKHFRPGINIIEIDKSCTLKITANTDDIKNDVIVFSDLSIVNLENSKEVINPRIAYFNDATSTNDILETIAVLDPNAEFYYNAVLDNSSTITINTQITNTNDANYETLKSPRLWYDYNNLNNKFVVSEIDSEYLKTGIIIDPSSKR